MRDRGLWIALAAVIVGSFAVLGGVGKQMIDNAPPVPSEVVVAGGGALFDGETIRNGQNVWQSLGGDAADWLHREATRARLEHEMRTNTYDAPARTRHHRG